MTNRDLKLRFVKIEQFVHSLASPAMAPLADFLLAYVPISLPHYLTSYVEGETPLSTTPAVLATLVSYLAVIFGIQAVMKNQSPHKLTPFFQTHNVILCTGSLVLLVLMLEEILPIMWKNGIFNALCAEEAWTPVRLSALEFPHYLLNTIHREWNSTTWSTTISNTLNSWTPFSLRLKRSLYVSCHYFQNPQSFLSGLLRVLEFLHVFHHSATALLCYSQLNGKTSIVSCLFSFDDFQMLMIRAVLGCDCP